MDTGGEHERGNVSRIFGGLVAGDGFEPPTFGLRARSEIVRLLRRKKIVCDLRDAESILNQALSMESDSYIASSFIPECVLRQKYLENQLSMREIASEFACSKTRVRDMLLNYNIPLRRRSQAPQHRSTTYGKRRLKGKIVEHKAELRAVATIKEHKAELRAVATIKQMYREGINTMAIARCLNTMKLPTKNQGKCWHQNTVAKILKREGVYVVGHKARGVLFT